MITVLFQMKRKIKKIFFEAISNIKISYLKFCFMKLALGLDKDGDYTKRGTRQRGDKTKRGTRQRRIW